MKSSRLFLVFLVVIYVHLINGEVIKGKSITRGKFEPEYKITTMDDRIIRVPFTSVMKIVEEKE